MVGAILGRLRMKISAAVLPKVEDSNTPALTQQYVCCVLNVYNGPHSGKEDEKGVKVKKLPGYSYRSTHSLAWLSCLQILCGALIFGAQIAPIRWHLAVKGVRNVDIYLKYDVFDSYGTGIYCGLFVLLTGVIGLLSVRRNRNALIAAHLVMNCFTLVCAIATIILPSISISELVDCKVTGVYTDVNSNSDDRYYDSYDRSDSTTDAPVYYALGEKLMREGHYHYNFYCENAIFTWWIVCEAFMIAFSLITIGSTIWFILQNSKAICFCCRSCCGDDEVRDDDVAIISSNPDKKVHI